MRSMLQRVYRLEGFGPADVRDARSWVSRCEVSHPEAVVATAVEEVSHQNYRRSSHRATAFNWRPRDSSPCDTPIGGSLKVVAEMPDQTCSGGDRLDEQFLFEHIGLPVDSLSLDGPCNSIDRRPVCEVVVRECSSAACMDGGPQRRSDGVHLQVGDSRGRRDCRCAVPRSLHRLTPRSLPCRLFRRRRPLCRR
jgi:hypothetical protein